LDKQNIDIFHLLQSAGAFEVIFFMLQFNAVSSENPVLNPDWSIQISGAPAIYQVPKTKLTIPSNNSQQLRSFLQLAEEFSKSKDTKGVPSKFHDLSLYP